VSRTSRGLLVAVVAVVTVATSCGGTSTLPPGRSVLESEIPSAIESSPTEPRVSTDSLETLPSDPSTPLEPVDPTPSPDSTTSPEPAPSAPEPPAELTGGDPDIVCIPVSVPTGSTQVDGERCDPGPFFSGPRPAALVLNGCGGYVADAEIGRAIATALAREGIVAVRVDYLGAAPTVVGCADPLTDLRASAEPVLRAVADTAALLRLDPGIDAGSIGAVGYSLGALTAMAAVLGGAGLAPTEPVPLSPVALLSYPNLLPDIPAALAAGFGPALFVMSGDADEVAPPVDSQTVVDAAFDGGVPVEQLVVAGQRHVWSGAAAALAASVLADELADRFAS
jgi:dienelactone hydrolase